MPGRSRHKLLGRRRKGIRWEYNGDGLFAAERWDTGQKRYWRRWLRRMTAQEAAQT